MAETVRDWVVWHAETRPEAVALRNGDDGTTTTWNALEHRVARLSGHLHDELGVRKRERVAVLAFGNPRVFEVQFACMRLGAIMVPLNWRLADAELSTILAMCEPATMVWDAAMSERAAALAHDSTIRAFGWDADGHDGYEDRLASARPLSARVDTSSDEITHILYTSGTTGLPKGALTSQQGMTAQAINCAHTSGVAEPGCHHLNPMPLFHAGGLHALANPILYFGGQVTTLERFVPQQCLAAMSRFRTTHFNSIPAMYAAMSDLPGFDTTDLSAMRLGVVAGAVAAPDLLERWHARGIAMQPQYGATETGPTVTALMPPDDLVAAKRGTAGQRAPAVEIRLVGPDGSEVRDGADGEIWVRGPAITPGYWHADRGDYFTHDWLRTGDVARRIDDHYHVVGRTKEMYKSGGENVYPAEVERVVASMPGVEDVAIVGVPDTKWGEVGLAVIVCSARADITLDEVRNYCRAELAGYKLPRRVVLVPELPRNVTGKVNRAALKEAYGAIA